jgi:hypothetical protein
LNAPLVGVIAEDGPIIRAPKIRWQRSKDDAKDVAKSWGEIHRFYKIPDKESG